jgi:hypothetical protein
MRSKIIFGNFAKSGRGLGGMAWSETGRAKAARFLHCCHIMISDHQIPIARHKRPCLKLRLWMFPDLRLDASRCIRQ